MAARVAGEIGAIIGHADGWRIEMLTGIGAVEM
jgi:hypothetical protein